MIPAPSDLATSSTTYGGDLVMAAGGYGKKKGGGKGHKSSHGKKSFKGYKGSKWGKKGKKFSKNHFAKKGKKKKGWHEGESEKAIFTLHFPMEDVLVVGKKYHGDFHKGNKGHKGAKFGKKVWDRTEKNKKGLLIPVAHCGTIVSPTYKNRGTTTRVTRPRATRRPSTSRSSARRPSFSTLTATGV